MTLWQLTLNRGLFGATDIPTVNLHAETIESAAQAVWKFLLHLEQCSGTDQPFALPEGTVSFSATTTLQSFFRPTRSVRIGIHRLHDGGHSNVTVGPGPERALYRHAISTATQDHRYWAPAASGHFFVPVFSITSIAIPERFQVFAAYGALLALHCFILGQGPIPISPWLLLALVSGKPGMLVPTPVLLALDPDAFDTLAPWLTMKVDDPMPSNLMHPVCQFLINVIERQPWEVAMAFMSKVLLGGTGFWDHPEYLALQRGFDIAVGDTTFVSSFAPRSPVAMLACLYDRQTTERHHILELSFVCSSSATFLALDILRDSRVD
ncbi:hypothetical protein B0H14DRAFT_3710538 [Mycena olivaceomarginata]|nr:hypothetical protein B0H14DRAFT_3710538 [Mycena olivaceomarginata]